jgi:serine/threonine protein kinase
MCKSQLKITCGEISATLKQIIFPTKETFGKCVIVHAIQEERNKRKDLAIKFVTDQYQCKHELNAICNRANNILLPIGGSCNTHVPGYGTFNAIAYKLINGCDLATFRKQKLHDGQTGDSFANVYIAYNIIDAVAHLHRQRIAHCDLKPENIMVCVVKNQWQLKIIDFGDATPFEQLNERLGGTKAYDAPEVIAMREQNNGNSNSYVITHARDIYSIGKSLYSVFTEGENGEENPDWLFALLRRMMNTEAKLRPTAEACIDEILNHLSLETVQQQCYHNFSAMMDCVFQHLRHEPTITGDDIAAIVSMS